MTQTSTSTPAKLTAAERPHHEFSMSKLNYIEDCPAYKGREGSSEAAEEGQAQHEIMDKVAAALVVAVREKKTVKSRDLLSAVLENEQIEAEEAPYLFACCKQIDSLLAREMPLEVYHEIKVAIIKPDKTTELNHGYIDLLLIFKGGVGVLFDWKFGWIPVKPASTNKQGFGYALACLQRFTNLTTVHMVFVQPKLGVTTRHAFPRAAVEALYAKISGIIGLAKHVAANPADAAPLLRPGPYCQWCTRCGSCTALLNTASVYASEAKVMALPKAFQGLKITTPEDMALARYWVDVLCDDVLEHIKEQAFQMALNNGGSISCTLPNGEVVSYVVGERNSGRALGGAMEVAEALSGILEPAQVLGAAELKITRLEPIMAAAIQLQESFEGRKITKKAAVARGCDTLIAHGLLTREDTKVRFLKRVKGTANQLPENTETKTQN